LSWGAVVGLVGTRWVIGLVGGSIFGLFDGLGLVHEWSQMLGWTSDHSVVVWLVVTAGVGFCLGPSFLFFCSGIGWCSSGASLWVGCCVSLWVGGCTFVVLGVLLGGRWVSR
jgi:hypothetical protein